jgi:hypothetical protein
MCVWSARLCEEEDKIGRRNANREKSKRLRVNKSRRNGKKVKQKKRK